MECTKRFCRILREAGQADRRTFRCFKTSLLSTEGKVLSALLENPQCIVKDIPALAGVSERSAFNCLEKFRQAGIISKFDDRDDRRTKHVKILYDAMCEKVCSNVIRYIEISAG